MTPFQLRQKRAATRSAIASVELEGVKISAEVKQILQQYSQASSPATRTDLLQSVLQATAADPRCKQAWAKISQAASVRHTPSGV